MPAPDTGWAASPESLVIALAGRGNRGAFDELMRRHQSGVRNLLRRLCADPTLADDLAQQVFIQLWQSLGQLTRAAAFGGWLKRIAINVWLQHQRRNDPLYGSQQIEDVDRITQGFSGAAIDLDKALGLLPGDARLCIVLSYHERMSHPQIAEVTGIALGTVKSHIRRGTQRLQTLLADYAPSSAGVDS